MSNRCALILLLAFGFVPAQPLDGQGLGVGGRVGTLGIGGEAAVELGDRVVLRGGLGLTPFEPKATLDEMDVTLKLPTWYNAGLDFYLNGAMRIGAGILFKAEDPSLVGRFNSPQDIGGNTYTPQEIGTLTGVIDSSDRVPYVLLGFGKHTTPGIGLFIDLGVAFLGDPEVRLESSGGTLSNDPAMQDALDREADNFERDMRTYLRFWPILSIGLRIGVS